MSDQSDELRQMFESIETPDSLDPSKLQGKAREIIEKLGKNAVGGVFLQAESLLMPETPLMEQGHDYYLEEIAAMLRNANRFFAGKDWPNIETARSETMEYLRDDSIKVIEMCFADALQIGQRETGIVRKYFFLDLENDLFDQDAFHRESELFLLGYLADNDVARVFASMFDEAMHGLQHAVRLDRVPDEMSYKIWDWWYMGLTNMTHPTYVAGYRLGAKWKERSTLDGILSATEDTDGRG